MEPDEALIAKIGNGFFINLLFRKPQKCSMMLTDKRLYLKGVFYSSGSKKILRTTEERILDLKDITGTGLIYIQLSRLTLVSFMKKDYPFLNSPFLAILGRLFNRSICP